MEGKGIPDHGFDIRESLAKIQAPGLRVPVFWDPAV